MMTMNISSLRQKRYSLRTLGVRGPSARTSENGQHCRPGQPHGRFRVPHLPSRKARDGRNEVRRPAQRPKSEEAEAKGNPPPRSGHPPRPRSPSGAAAVAPSAPRSTNDEVPARTDFHASSSSGSDETELTHRLSYDAGSEASLEDDAPAPSANADAANAAADDDDAVETTVVCGLRLWDGFYTGEIDARRGVPHGVGTWRSAARRGAFLEGRWTRGRLDDDGEEGSDAGFFEGRTTAAPEEEEEEEEEEAARGRPPARMTLAEKLAAEEEERLHPTIRVLHDRHDDVSCLTTRSVMSRHLATQRLERVWETAGQQRQPPAATGAPAGETQQKARTPRDPAGHRHVLRRGGQRASVGGRSRQPSCRYAGQRMPSIRERSESRSGHGRMRQ